MFQLYFFCNPNHLSFISALSQKFWMNSFQKNPVLVGRVKIEATNNGFLKKNVRLQFCLNKKSLIYKLWETPFSTTCISGIFYLGKNEDVHFFFIEFFLRFFAASEHLPPLVVGEDVQNITILYFNSFFWIPHEILVKKNVIAPIYDKFWNLNKN